MNRLLNKSLLALALTALPTLGFAAGNDPAPATPAASTQEVGFSEFEKNGLGLSFNAGDIQVTGLIARPCGELLSIKDIKKQAPSSSDAGLEAESDLDLHASKVGLRVLFSGGTSYKDLAECQAKNKDSTDKMDLSLRTELSKSILDKDEVATAGILNDKNEIVLLKDAAQSLSYRRLKQQLEDKTCKNCNGDAKSVKRRLEQLASLDFPWVQPLMKSLIDAALNETNIAINEAKSLHDLEGLLKDLSDYAKAADHLNLESSEKGRIMGAIAKNMDQLLERNQSLALQSRTNCDQKQAARTFYKSSGVCSSESNHADFIAKTYSEISKLPGMDKDSRAEAARISKTYEMGGSARLEFISSINPASSEVRAALNAGGLEMNALSNEVRRACSFVFNERQFERCNSAKQAYSNSLNQLNMLAQRFMSAQRMTQAQPNSTSYGNTGPYSGYGSQSAYGYFGNTQKPANGNYPNNAVAIPLNGNYGSNGSFGYQPRFPG